MTLHASDAAVTAQAKKMAKKKSRKYTAVGAAGAVLLTAGGAWAAMTVFGSGTASVTAGQEKELQIVEASFSDQLYPATSVDLIIKVKNPNPFKVKVKTIGLKAGENPTVTCTGNDAQYLSGPFSTQDPTVTLPAADQATINGGGYVSQIKISNAIRLSNDAKKGCALTVPFTITGESVA